MTEERLKELKDLCDKATPGPWIYDWGNWQVESGNPDHSRAGVANAVLDEENHYESFGLKGKQNDPVDNCLFIAESRTAIPELIAEVERLKEKLKEYRPPNIWGNE